MCIKILHHVCIQTDKYKESLDFYTNVLGFKVIRESKDFHTRDYLDKIWRIYDRVTNC